MPEQYLLIRDTADSAIQSLPPSNGTNVPHQVTWFDQTTRRLGAVRITPNDKKSFAFPFFPALSDIDLFEMKSSENFGAGYLCDLAERGAAVLHGMGYYKSYGTRTFMLVTSDGKVSVREPSEGDNDSVCREVELIRLARNGGKSIDQYVTQLVTSSLIAAPDSCLFLHYLGNGVDIDAIGRLVIPHSDYVSIDAQIRQGLEVPDAQKANVNTAAGSERKLILDPGTTYMLLEGFSKERDHATYYVIADGDVFGSNNRRGVRGIIERLRDRLKKKEHIFA